MSFFPLTFIAGLINEVELGAQSVIYELASIMNMVLTVIWSDLTWFCLVACVPESTSFGLTLSIKYF